MMTNYSDSSLKATEDWRYSNPKMEVRSQALTILLKRFGSELNENENQSIVINPSMNVFMIGFLKVI